MVSTNSQGRKNRTEFDLDAGKSGPDIYTDEFKTLDVQEKLEKRLNYLNNRMQHLSGKLNQSVSMNKEIRAQIDQLRRERVVFDKIYRDLESDYLQAKMQFIKCQVEKNKTMALRDKTLEQMKQI